MTRKEAKKHVGQRVSAWTAVNGSYVGFLIEVLNTRPWRGRVRIVGVLQPALAFEFRREVPRRGFRPGEAIEVGGINIAPTSEVGGCYLEALKADLAKWKNQVLLYQSQEFQSTAKMIAESSIQIRKRQIEAEIHAVSEFYHFNSYDELRFSSFGAESQHGG